MSAIPKSKSGSKKESGRHSAPLHACPKCQSYTDVRVENAKIIDRYFFWMSLKKYHCTDCQHQFYISAK